MAEERQEWLQQRAAEARERAQEAKEAAKGARERVEELAHREGGVVGVSIAEERRIHAEERLARLQSSLAEARQRSVNAHERAARLDEEVGKGAEAERHRHAADEERQLIDDEAVRATERQRKARPLRS